MVLLLRGSMVAVYAPAHRRRTGASEPQSCPPSPSLSPSSRSASLHHCWGTLLKKWPFLSPTLRLSTHKHVEMVSFVPSTGLEKLFHKQHVKKKTIFLNEAQKLWLSRLKAPMRSQGLSDFGLTRYKFSVLPAPRSYLDGRFGRPIFFGQGL